MDQLTLEKNIIYEGEKIIGTITFSRNEITIDGSVNIQLKKNKKIFDIIENSLPIGKLEKNLRIVYQGKIYEPDRKSLSDFITGRGNKLEIYSNGTLSGTIERENQKLIVKSDFPIEKVVFIIYLALFSRYRLPAYGGRRRTLPSPYREIYYTLFGLFIVAFVLLNFINLNIYYYTVIMLAIIIGMFVVSFIGNRKSMK